MEQSKYLPECEVRHHEIQDLVDEMFAISDKEVIRILSQYLYTDKVPLADNGSDVLSV